MSRIIATAEDEQDLVGCLVKCLIGDVLYVGPGEKENFETSDRYVLRVAENFCGDRVGSDC